ncbi:hypothetical protein ACP70R_040838 [Stipagrostis hirtigluma subsp. patula]
MELQALNGGPLVWHPGEGGRGEEMLPPFITRRGTHAQLSIGKLVNCVRLAPLFRSNIEDITRGSGIVDVDEESPLCCQRSIYVPTLHDVIQRSHQ